MVCTSDSRRNDQFISLCNNRVHRDGKSSKTLGPALRGKDVLHRIKYHIVLSYGAQKTSLISSWWKAHIDRYVYAYIKILYNFYWW